MTMVNSGLKGLTKSWFNVGQASPTEDRWKTSIGSMPCVCWIRTEACISSASRPHWLNIVSIMAHRLGRWPNIKTTYIVCLELWCYKYISIIDVIWWHYHIQIIWLNRAYYSSITLPKQTWIMPIYINISNAYSHEIWSLLLTFQMKYYIFSERWGKYRILRCIL